MLDEGLFVIADAVPAHKKPVAMVCLAEKGNVTLELAVEASPGHASNPPVEGAVGVLARAVSRLERRPMVCHFDSAGAMLGALGGGFGWPLQVPRRAGWSTALALPPRACFAAPSACLL